MGNKALTVEEFAAALQISKPTAYNIIHSKHAPPVIHVGRCIRIPVSGFERWLDNLSESGVSI